MPHLAVQEGLGVPPPAGPDGRPQLPCRVHRLRTGRHRIAAEWTRAIALGARSNIMTGSNSSRELVQPTSPAMTEVLFVIL